MKKICLVIPSLQSGGMERVMSELSTYFCSKEEFEVHLVLYGLTREIFYSIPNNIIIHKPSFEFDNSKRTWNTLKTLWFLRKKIKDVHPDTVLSFGELWNNFVLLATLGLKYPVFVSDRSQPDKSLGFLHNHLRKWLYPKATGVIAQTKKAKEIYKNIYHNTNITVIGNPIRPILSKNKTTALRKNVVLMVGRLITTKHQDRLIDIFIKINNPDWKLILVGYDHLKQKHSDRLQKIIEDNNAQDRILLAGKQSDVEKYYLESKIFAFTSSSEGFPNVIGEALSAGLPVVSYDCVAGPSDLIMHGENGFLVPVFDDAVFKENLELLMKDEALRKKMAEKAIMSIQKFDKQIIAEAFRSFIIQ
jgi:GalNAc-alpha-(1->4)-GalNAc-alpha-(1->3)-diNAcBac-PP-undecaprenol alpha-1,4-N-acetyl-D-galactosaminyltransferase